jgi:ribosomal protein S18 acetylase RimI-like enzyme
MDIEIFTLADDSPYLKEAVEVYNEYVAGDLRYQEHFFRSHIGREGYRGFVARHKNKTVGVAFGSCSLRGQWWHERVAAHVGKEHEALQGAWVLTQLNVLAAYRNQKLGTLLHDTIIKAQPCKKLLLSTPVSNKAAQRFYLRHGWYFVHDGFVFSSGDIPYAIMAKTL